VGDGTGHATDGGKLLGLEKIALAFQEAGPHAVEDASEIGDFISAAGIQGMMEISALESAYAFHQIGERAGEGVRNEKDESAADENGGKTEQE
jgi:hypothetical protein